jgi:putative ABC transport system substrate-binding protein
MMDRRRLIGGTAALLAARAARAQVPGRVYRIGYLGYTATNPADGDRAWSAFVQRLRELGYAEGGNLVIESRFAEGRNERYAEFGAEMVKLRADLVVATSGTAARAVMAASGNLPIVTTAIPDPLRSGLVASLARPGGQLTGITNFAEELTPKRLELLKAAVPAARLIAFARCPVCALTGGEGPAAVNAMYREHEAAARSLGVKWLPLDVNAAADFGAAAAALRRERPDALLIGATQINVALREEWLAFAAQQRLPMLAPYRGFGAMLSYGPDIVAIYRKAAEYVARILGGANPGELPMEQPTKFEFVVDLRLAKALGLTIPQSLLLRADEVIE